MIDVPQLQPGRYPFLDDEYDLDDMAFVEAPRDLETFLKSAAHRNGSSIIRNEVVRLRFVSEATDSHYMVYWPRGTERIYILVPREAITGRA